MYNPTLNGKGKKICQIFTVSNVPKYSFTLAESVKAYILLVSLTYIYLSLSPPISLHLTFHCFSFLWREKKVKITTEKHKRISSSPPPETQPISPTFQYQR
ncbi:hypothetical protein HS088_TW02G00281 [Tripterygium wilfordii]|uniref:Uncharacterized protein n=1 Tax=Tripterygium wilfordii TaxID=458696 RepID=A0A7J7DYC2_TRIWF|nr:hypothetical protein HS088_TW02G00281 [Tripterygium wilfordii]